MARAKQPDPVLSAEDYEFITQNLEYIEQMPRTLKQACQVGIDCSEHEKALAKAKEAFQKLLSVYFPKGRPK